MPSLPETGPLVRRAPQVPHSTLRAYYPCEEERCEWVRSLFDRTAGDYERMERLMTLGSGSRYRRCALQRASKP
jgi:demethylmenaquinone methyltransferase / 2-methoxy-6-polyprenyl-1,4-benzoquinol methylase